ncbi:MAG TPA: FCD domain-containing protein [Solirubrobacteraceae bacterium]|nr:FCD domain-containing protein [Solirubrobacteraceae bacterium]
MEGATALGAVFDKVQPPTTFEETVERLGTAIRLGLLGPGTRLPPERELAGQLGISRSTLRQALTTLVQSGHLISLRGRSGGTFVSEEPPMSSGRKRLRPDWKDVLDQRVAIECGAALLAAERGNEKAFQRLDGVIEQMDEPPDFDDYRRADVRFHIGLAEAAGTPRLVALMTEVQGEMSELISLIAHPRVVLEHANVEHRRIVKCLRGGDGVGAIRILRDHLVGTEHIIAGLIPPGAAGN